MTVAAVFGVAAIHVLLQQGQMCFGPGATWPHFAFLADSISLL